MDRFTTLDSGEPRNLLEKTINLEISRALIGPLYGHLMDINEYDVGKLGRLPNSEQSLNFIA
jgi:hypothetical protein